jgi:pilus assembly protein CpaC
MGTGIEVPIERINRSGGFVHLLCQAHGRLRPMVSFGPVGSDTKQRTVNSVWIRSINRTIDDGSGNYMTPRLPIRTALLMAAIAVGVVATDDRAQAAPQRIRDFGHQVTRDCVDLPSAAERGIRGVSLVGSDATTECVHLWIGKSRVYDFSNDIKNVLVADPQIANVTVLSTRRAHIIGKATGSTSIIFFDGDGNEMARFEITVIDKIQPLFHNVQDLSDAINDFLCAGRTSCPDHVTVKPVGDGILLTGSVANQLLAQQAYDIAAHYVAPPASGSNGSSSNSGGGQSVTVSSAPAASGGLMNSQSASKIVNAIVVRGGEQVMLKVTVAEMDRQIIKQLGVNMTGSFNIGTNVVNFNNANPFPVNGALSGATSFNPFGVVPLVPSNIPVGVTGTVGQSMALNLQAMEQAGVVRTLAEPSLTAISGESAHFLVGGSFPIPSLSCTGTVCTPSFTMQPFGVGLNFTPVVLSEGRISLHVATEVSAIDTADSVTISGTTVPGLSVRRADTTAEISSGGTLVMAGMIEDQTKQTISGLPGVMEMPILGTLFKSRDYLNNKTELVVLVTPYIARAVAQKDLSRPDDGFTDASDPASVLLGRLNRIYGVRNSDAPNVPYYGRIGFILD